MIRQQNIDELRRGADAAQPEQRRKRPASDAPIGSEIALSKTFVEAARGKFRWSSGLDWMRNDGRLWERDDTLGRYTLSKDICTAAASAPDLSDYLRRAMTSAKTVSATLMLARDADGVATPADAWDRNPMLLNTPAGPFDLETGRLVAARDELFTQITGTAPDATMPTPLWDRALSEIFCGDLELVEFTQRWVGYCLTGDRREQKIAFWHGTGANGKSMLEEVVRNVAGTYALNLPPDVLMRQQHQQHPTELAQLRGKRVAISSELEDGAYWAESRVKTLTGDATLRARFMRGDFFEFPMTQKHIMLGNFKPRLKGDDPAIARRMLLVPFLQEFTGIRCDKNLPKKLRAEYAGILAWFIAGAAKWARDGLLIPKVVQDASAEYLSDHDDIGLWIKECCVTGPMHRASTSKLYTSFAQWKDAGGEHAQSKTAWGQRMGHRFEQYRLNHERGYKGLALLDDGADEYPRQRG